MSIHGASAVDLSKKSSDHSARSDIYVRRSWGNWVLLAATFVITTAGLRLVITTLVPDRLVNPWPWVRTDVTLVSACRLLVVTLILHLTREQRNLGVMHVA